MLVLGIESTAHTFGVSVLKDTEILSNIRDIYTTETGGLVPVKLQDHHVECCEKVIKDALEKANINGKNITIKDIELISFSRSPGMGNTLRIGAIVARTLSLLNNIPIIGVNHAIAHLEIGKMMTGAKDPVMLYASGANTQIIALYGGKYRVFGESLDTGIGNFIDTVAREMDLGFPGGPLIEELAEKYRHRIDGKLIDLPYSVKGMDVAFSGLLHNIKVKLENFRVKFKNSGKEFDREGFERLKEEIAFSAQEVAFAMLVEVSERAMAHCDKKELILGGGVGCNKRLQEMCTKMCEERGAKFFVPPKSVLIDNAAMIAWLGFREYSSGRRMDINSCQIDPYERVDDVEVLWDE